MYNDDNSYLTPESTPDYYKEARRSTLARPTHAVSPRVLSEIEKRLVAPKAFETAPTSKYILETLAMYNRLPRSTLRIFSSVSAALESVGETYLRPRDALLLSAPIDNYFAHICEQRDAQTRFYFGESPFDFDAAGLIKAARRNAKVVYLMNPNILTGATCGIDKIKAIADNLPDAMIVVDERYYEFFGVTAAQLARLCDNLIVVRSLFEGMAPAEYVAGYIISSPANLADIDELSRRCPPSEISVAAAAANLRELDFNASQIKIIRENTISVATKLRRFGLNVQTTPADRILIEIKNPDKCQEYLNERGIRARSLSDFPQLEGYISLFVDNDSYSESIIQAFEAMPQSIFREPDRRSRITLYRSSEFQPVP
jgi:histidinol-phosphate aminotransferase